MLFSTAHLQQKRQVVTFIKQSWGGKKLSFGLSCSNLDSSELCIFPPTVMLGGGRRDSLEGRIVFAASTACSTVHAGQGGSLAPDHQAFCFCWENVCNICVPANGQMYNRQCPGDGVLFHSQAELRPSRWAWCCLFYWCNTSGQLRPSLHDHAEGWSSLCENAEIAVEAKGEENGWKQWIRVVTSKHSAVRLLNTGY